MLTLAGALLAAYPSGTFTMDKPLGNKSELFLDAEVPMVDGGVLDLVFQARVGRGGIGLSVIEAGAEGEGYGEGPDEVLGGVGEVLVRVAELIALG